MPSNFDINICYFFCYSSQQFDEEDEDETDGKPNPAAAAKAALGMILCQFKHRAHIEWSFTEWRRSKTWFSLRVRRRKHARRHARKRNSLKSGLGAKPLSNRLF